MILNSVPLSWAGKCQGEIVTPIVSLSLRDPEEGGWVIAFIWGCVGGGVCFWILGLLIKSRGLPESWVRRSFSLRPWVFWSLSSVVGGLSSSEVRFSVFENFRDEVSVMGGFIGGSCVHSASSTFPGGRRGGSRDLHGTLRIY